MNKILLIIQREYLSRVKKKSFLVVTFAVPVLFMGMMALMVYLTINQSGLSDKKKVKVVDEMGWYANKLNNSTTIDYTYDPNFTKAKQSFIKDGYDYLLYIPPNNGDVQLLGEKTPGALHTSAIEDELSRVARTRRLGEAHIDSSLLAAAQMPVKVKPKQVNEKGVQDVHIWASYGVGLLCAFLIYISLLLYGAQVMRGVIEEKVSRIIEVIISSVKPFQLMLGKIIGVGMVGLTQFIMWIALSLVLSAVGGSFMAGSSFGAAKNVQAMQTVGHQVSAGSAHADRMAEGGAEGILQSLNSLPGGTIVGCFLFYFLFGYLIYSALFAAVGSAVDNETETQQFMLPLTLPLIFTIFISQTVIVNNPDSALSVWLSMIPFTSPIAMMIRIPFGVPWPQIAASMLFMVLGFLVTTWVASRIYRVGILMYGKKASYKELAKWFMYKE